MRISDWSSDVCSSDLVRAYDPEGMDAARAMMSGVEFCDNPYVAAQGAAAVVIVTEWDALRALDLPRLKGIMSGDGLVDLRNIRSEEHTSELQSLMRISYAVFCLKKKKTQKVKQ